MRAVQFDDYGDIDVLQVRDVPAPTPGPGQVVVEVRAAGINPGEAKIREGALHARWPSTFPEGEGSDFAGVMSEVGTGVTGFAEGDQVLGFTDNRDSHAERVLAEADRIVAKPDGLSWEVAGSLFIVGTSAYALVQTAGIGPDDVVIVSGAAGGVGSTTVQWARNAGATVVGLASASNHPWLEAQQVIGVEYGDGAEPLPERIRAALDGRQATALLDTFGSSYVQLGLDLGIAPERIATVADFSANELGAQLVFHSSVARAAVLTELADAAATGRLEIPIAATYPLDGVRDAYAELERGHTHGKIVLLP